MTTTINADNVTGGAVVTGDSSGELGLQTAGTTRMTITSAGNVGIGTSTPGYKLDVTSSTIPASLYSSATPDGNKATLVLNGTVSSGNSFAGVRFTHNVFTTGWGADILTTDPGNYNANLLFRTSAGGASTTTPTERMRITYDGNVGIGTSSPVGKLEISGGAANTYFRIVDTRATYPSYIGAEQGALVFGQWGLAERMRIDSSGNFFVGGTTQISSSKSNFYTDSNAPSLGVFATDANYTSRIFFINCNRSASSAFNLCNFDANGTGQFRVQGDGVIYAQNTTVQSISDVRLKENIRNANDGLDVICALRTVRYDWKAGYGNDRKNQLGFIAQEVEAVFPEAVSEWKDVKEDDETVYKTVGPGALIPVLVKAIQEQQQQIDALKAEVAALKGN